MAGDAATFGDGHKCPRSLQGLRRSGGPLGESEGTESGTNSNDNIFKSVAICT